MSSLNTIPTFPYDVVTPDEYGRVDIALAPVVPAERAFFLLLTSREFQSGAHNFGSVTAGGRSVLNCLHMMASIAISHRNNVYTLTPAYEKLDASNVIFRTFMHGGRFAIMMQVNIGADPNPIDTKRDTNLHYCAPLRNEVVEQGRGGAAGRGGRGGGRGGRGGRGGAAAATAPMLAADDEFMNEVVGIAMPGDDFYGGGDDLAMAGAPQRRDAEARQRIASGMCRTRAIRIYEPAVYVSAIFKKLGRRRLEESENGPLLVPKLQPLVRGTDCDARLACVCVQMSDADFRTLLMLPLRSDLNEMAYLKSFLKRVAIFGDYVVPNLGRNANRVQHATLTQEQYDAVSDAEDERFALKQPYSFFRVATSLPNCLAQLRQWGESVGVRPDVLTAYTESRSYIDAAGVNFSSPVGVPTYMMDVGDMAMETFLTMPLPLPMTYKGLLATGEMQIALCEFDNPRILMQVVRSVNNIDAGSLRRLLMQGTIDTLQRRLGGDGIDSVPVPGAPEPILPASEILRVLLNAVMPDRYLHAHIFDLRDYMSKWRKNLLGQRSAAWERTEFRQMALRALRDMHAAGVDEDVVSRATLDAMDGNLNPVASGKPIDMAAELANFRHVFGKSKWGDLNHGADYIAAMCEQLKNVTNMKVTWLDLFIVMLASSASASTRLGKLHVCLLGPAASGKSMIILWAQRLAWQNLTRSAVHISEASTREAHPTRNSRCTDFAEESGGIGNYVSPQARTNALSKLSEEKTTHRTIGMIKDPPDPRRARFLVESSVYACSSEIIATNIPPSDEVSASRYSIRTMSTLSRPSQAFIESANVKEQASEFSGAEEECAVRAIRFFTLLMAAIFTLDSIGAAEIPQYNVNIAIVNKITPPTTDASMVRRTVRLAKMTHVLSAWCGMFKFLLSPFSPLTLLYNDHLTLESLSRMPDFMSVSCAPGLFIASLSPLLNDDLFFRTIIHILVSVAFKPSNSLMHAAYTQYRAELTRLRQNPVFREAAALERGERKLQLKYLRLLFPVCRNQLIRNPHECVMFNIQTLERYTSNSGATTGDDRGDHNGFVVAPTRGRPLRRANSGASAAAAAAPPANMSIYNRFGGLRMMGEDSRDGYDARDEMDGGEDDDAAAGPPPPLQMGNFIPTDQDVLTGEHQRRAMDALIAAIYPILTSKVFELKAQVKKRRPDQTGDGVKADIREVLNRMQFVCLTNGMYACHHQNLAIEDEAAALEKIQEFTEKYDIPSGAYVTAQVVHPHPMSEVLEVVTVANDPTRKPLDDLMDQYDGRVEAIITALSAQSFRSADDRESLLCLLDPSQRNQDPTAWAQQHAENLLRSGLALARTASCRRVLAVFNAEQKEDNAITMQRLFCRPIAYTVRCRSLLCRCR